MDGSELKRYNRQILLPEVGLAGQLKLKAAAVLVVGAGGLGAPVLLYLASAGIGKIGIVDHDVVDESNLHRQILFNNADIGKSKAETAVNKLQLLNPHIDLKAYPIKINEGNAESLILDYDLIIDGSDNFPTRYLVNDVCVLLNKPLVFGSIFRFEGQVSVFNYNGGASYRSLYPEPPLAQEVPNCNESGVIGTLPAIIGSYMANETIKLICGFGEILTNKLLIFNALNNSSVIFNLTSHETTGPLPHYISDYEEIKLETYAKWESNGQSALLIDVREEYEFDEYNIGGLNIPLYELNDHIGSIPADREIVLCCTSGSRSKIAFNLLKDKIRQKIFILGLNT